MPGAVTELPRDAQERYAPANPAGPLSRRTRRRDSPRKGLSSRPLSLRRSKARGSPSVASPFGGMTVHRTLAFCRLTHWTFA